MDLKSVQSLWQVPSIVQYCNAFGTLFSLPEMEIEDLEAALLEKDSFLILELLCRLMEGILTSGKSGKAKGKQKKIWSHNCMSILEEINARFQLKGWPDKANSTFFDFSLESKVQVLYELCTLKLENNEEEIKDYPAELLRPMDLGRDSHGSNYFYFGGTRLYKETPKETRHRSTDDEETEEEAEDATRASTWAVQCFKSNDWERLSSLLSSSRDTELSRKICLLWKENEVAIREAEMRQSTRMRAKKLREEEEEYIQKEKEKKVRAEEEKQRKKREKLESELQKQRKRQEMEQAKKERESRFLMRKKRADLIAEGKEIPPELLQLSGKPSAIDETSSLDEEIVDKLMKVLKACFKCRDSWAFQDEVENVPDYLDVIQNPMNLNRMKIKLEDEFYNTVEEFTSDMDLIVSNCILYNGKDSEYTEMAMKLETCFKRAMDRFMPVASSSDDKDEDFGIKTPNKRARKQSDSDPVSVKRLCTASRVMNSAPNIAQSRTTIPDVINRITIDTPSGVPFLVDIVDIMSVQ